MTCEVAPFTLLFCDADIKDGETNMKVIPPIRDKREQEIIRYEVKETSIVDAIASYHFPVEKRLKQGVHGNFYKAFEGAASIEFTLPALYTAFKSELNADEEGPLSQTEKRFFRKTVRMMSEGPARILGVEREKGGIQQGKEASFFIFDPRIHYMVDKGMVYSRQGESNIYLGRKLWGQVHTTVLRGKPVYENGLIS